VSLPKRAETPPYSSESLVAAAVALVSGVLPASRAEDVVSALAGGVGLSVGAVSALAEAG
jgi:hypothetical protein